MRMAGVCAETGAASAAHSASKPAPIHAIAGARRGRVTGVGPAGKNPHGARRKAGGAVGLDVDPQSPCFFPSPHGTTGEVSERQAEGAI